MHRSQTSSPLEVANDDHQQHSHDTVTKPEGEGRDEGHRNIVENIQGNNNSNHKTFSIDDILRPKALKLQPGGGYVPQQGLIQHDKNYNFTFDPSARPQVAHHHGGVPGGVFSSVIRGHSSSKDLHLSSAHKRDTLVMQQSYAVKDVNERVAIGSKEGCQTYMVSPSPSRRFIAAERSGDAHCFSGRDGRCSTGATVEQATTAASSAAAATAAAVQSPSQREASQGSPASHDGSNDVLRGDRTSPPEAPAVPRPASAEREREYHGVPSVPHPTYPAPPPIHQQSLPTVCLPLPPVSFNKVTKIQILKFHINFWLKFDRVNNTSHVVRIFVYIKINMCNSD